MPGEHAGEAERGPDAGDVHVLDAGLDVVAAGAHVLEADRVERALLARQPRAHVDAGARVGRAVVAPDLVTRLRLHYLRRGLGVFVRQAAFEQVGRLDQVIVG
ncbi:hypothetical protein ACFQQB_23495 [Nonomuraea rubra]|uniref:hypothetical protein n=1 Tax=Nonomuraea rubra TaxID=46180 RepID=UPI00361A6CA8